MAERWRCCQHHEVRRDDSSEMRSWSAVLRQVEEGVSLGELQDELAHVEARGLEAPSQVLRQTGTGGIGSERLAKAELGEVLGKAGLGLRQRSQLFHQL